MTYWAIANASHHNFNGRTGGIKFFKDLVRNIQLFDNDIGICFENLSIPSKLNNFLKAFTVPYLIPESPSSEFKSSLAGLCDIGIIQRCSNATRFDVDFELFMNEKKYHAFVECKYQDKAQGKNEISAYIDRAKANNSVLTICLSHEIRKDLKFKSVNKKREISCSKIAADLSLSRLDPEAEAIEPGRKKAKKDFMLNIYSFFFENVDKKAVGVSKKRKMVGKIVEEVNDPDGVFIVLQTNFHVRKI